MVKPPPSPALTQYIDDELLRAPLLFDQVAEGAVDAMRRALPGLSAYERGATSDLIQSLGTHRSRLAEQFTRSLREQVANDLARQNTPESQPKPVKAKMLALVEEDAVAMDVEISHTIEAIKSTAEHELRELRTYVAALVGDLDVSADHNPFRPEVYARALWAAVQILPMSRGHQVNLMRHAAMPLALILRQSYAAACSRLESMGVEPATYRTVIMPGGSRRSTGPETTYAPDLYRMRETMPAPLDDGPLRYEGQLPAAMRRESWIDVAKGVGNRPDRQAIELVSRLFEAILGDERVPADVNLLISRLHGPAMRLTLRDSSVLDQNNHPLWRFIHLVAYEAEMVPDGADPERTRLLRLAQQIIDQIAADTDQRTSIYRRAVQRVEEFLRQRLERRCAAAATQIGAMQKLEKQLLDGDRGPDTLSGMVDLPVMDTVPAEFLVDDSSDPHAENASEAWLDSLRTGTWVRMFLQGRWVQAQLLWLGDRGEVWLFGDGGSDATWAVRRSALLRLHGAALAKTLRMRSLLGRAAIRVQQQVAAMNAPPPGAPRGGAAGGSQPS